MSISNFTDTVPFSISGLQDLVVNTINGGGFITNITIAGQVAFLNWDTTTETLTLLIPTQNGVIALGLLSNTDWNTFNSKENTLTFISPLRRIGNTIDFDFSTTNIFSGNNTFSSSLFYTGATVATTPDILFYDVATGLITRGAVPTFTNLLPLNNSWTGTNTFNNNTFMGGPIFYTGATIATTPDILYYDVASALITRGAVPTFTNLLPLNNTWTGTNTFNNSVNINNSRLLIDPVGFLGGDIIQFFRGSSGAGEYLFFNTGGSFGYWNGSTVTWFISSVGNATLNNSFMNGTQTNRNLAGATYSLQSFINATAHPTLEFFFVQVNGDVGYFGQLNPLFPPPTGGNVWRITSSGDAEFRSIATRNPNQPNQFNFSNFRRSPAINNWITATYGVGAQTFGQDGDLVVIGNIFPSAAGFGACVGGHDFILSAWRRLDLNPFSLTDTLDLRVRGVFTNPSDRRLKTDIRYLDAGKSINFIKRLKPCIYRRCDEINDPYVKEEDQPKRKLQLGFIADEIEDIAETEAQKSLITISPCVKLNDCKQLAMLQLLPEIVQANKEMIDKIETLEDKVDKLEEDNKVLMERLSKIEEILKNKKCIAFI